MTNFKWRLLAGAATASLCLASALSAHASTGWASTHTQAIPLVKAKLLGAVDPAQPMHIAVALQMQNAQALQNLVQQQATPGSSNFNKYITPAQFNATYAPSSASVAAVTSYLASAGLGNISVAPNGLFVTATGTAAQVQAAFNTSLFNFNQKGKQIFVNTTPVQVPQALNGIVLSVLGLNNVPATSPITECDVAKPKCLRLTYNPQTYWRAYDAVHVAKGAKTSIAIMAEGDVSSVTPDLRTFEAAMGLAQVPVTVVQVGRREHRHRRRRRMGPRHAVHDRHGRHGEEPLHLRHDLADRPGHGARIQSLGHRRSRAGRQRLVRDRASSSPISTARWWRTTRCSSRPPRRARPCSHPPATRDRSAPSARRTAFRQARRSWAIPRHRLTSIGVGGTTLLTNKNGGYTGEVAWYAGGGGISQFEGSPYWQASVVPTNNGLPVTFRAIPDVSMDADPNTGAIVYVNGQSEVIGGTSLSSPLAAGAWARLQTSYGNVLGFAGPRLYAGYPAFGTSPTGVTQKVDGFNDVLVGTDGLYTALPDYDFTTGLGSIDLGQKQPLLPH